MKDESADHHKPAEGQTNKRRKAGATATAYIGDIDALRRMRPVDALTLVPLVQQGVAVFTSVSFALLLITSALQVFPLSAVAAGPMIQEAPPPHAATPTLMGIMLADVEDKIQ